MFIAALFKMAKMWKQPKYPSADEWMNKMWSICTLLMKPLKEGNFPICNNMDGSESIMLSEVSQIKTNTICFYLCVESKK